MKKPKPVTVGYQDIGTVHCCECDAELVGPESRRKFQAGEFVVKATDAHAMHLLKRHCWRVGDKFMCRTCVQTKPVVGQAEPNWQTEVNPWQENAIRELERDQ